MLTRTQTLVTTHPAVPRVTLPLGSVPSRWKLGASSLCLSPDMSGGQGARGRGSMRLLCGTWARGHLRGPGRALQRCQTAVQSTLALWLLKAQPRNTWSVPSAHSGPASPARPPGLSLAPLGRAWVHVQLLTRWLTWHVPVMGSPPGTSGDAKGTSRPSLRGLSLEVGATAGVQVTFLRALGCDFRQSALDKPNVDHATSERAVSWGAVVTEAPGFPPWLQ